MDPSTYQRVDEAVEDFAHEVGPKSINLTEEIGNGEFGNVYRGVWRVDRKEQRFIAVKTLKVKDLCLGREGGGGGGGGGGCTSAINSLWV